MDGAILRMFGVLEEIVLAINELYRVCAACYCELVRATYKPS